ncbi:MAG: glycosyltransferase family 2 protein [Proteobacteria bacterium]|nr:glycosyltransferase family 2 protein [Desulfobulbaceae bacterium]MBU4154006.1 glycosyltransferase family 2 protein [Pseudomonadota bacterium]
MLDFVFVLSIAGVGYAYFGYPFSLYIIQLFHFKAVHRELIQPKVTLIITAFNEGKRIREKLENAEALTYPKERIQILVASDGSTDDTNNIVREFARSGIELLDITPRQGKENAQKEAVRSASGDILVFSDVATRMDPDALDKVVRNFADPSVGSVSSEDRLIGADGKPSGEGAYVRYEMWLRRLESRVNTLVGLSGSFFAARREVCQDFVGDVQSDFRTLLTSVRLGYRGISDPEVIGYYKDIADEKREFERKVRTVLRGITVFFRHTEFLNPFRYGLFAYQYFCHKLLRWCVPLFLLAAFFSNLLLVTRAPYYVFFMLCQIAFYGAAGYGWQKGGSSSRLLKIPMYFVMANYAILVAWWKFWGGQRVVLWTPSER